MVLKSGATATPDDIRAHCKGLIGGYKCPRSVDFVPAMPMSGAGKVLKSELRARHWGETDRAVN